ncbi:response regulator [Desulfobulbus oralis]|uniref:histidine kinase n=1 Tax=Desulfobulbus oralis TaxID=1986146 RepID=A0A2L1GLF2_9BACT|nr:response regulator [Desulfobulbus oralis]AVD70499.1 hypothetical protein CAY53_02600 [Desulfobulbus oralis]
MTVPNRPETSPRTTELSAGQPAFPDQISHEIRTPLNAIIGYAEMLQKTALDDRQRHYADNIVKSGLALVDILDGWLVQARDKKGRGIKPAGAATGRAAAMSAPGTEPFRILVIEDSPLIRDLFTDIFSEGHYSVQTAADGASGLECAVTGQPDLIFLDLHLSDSDGWQIARNLRGNPASARIPLVLMTGQTLAPDSFRPLFDDLLQKPFQLAQLRATVATWQARLASGQGPAGPSLARTVRPFWEAEMGRLLTAIVYTGSLPLTIELGQLLETRGEERNCPPMRDAGRQLLHCATAPDIAGIDAIVSQLTPLLEGHKP